MHRVRDPVCGMMVDPLNAMETYEHKAQTYYFCSAHCLKRFGSDPKEFLKGQYQQSMEPHGTTGPTKYICSMCPGVESNKPGACPKCGMALEPDIAVAPATNTKGAVPDN